ncbi:MAG: molybdopterin-dependent oxidoreductase [Bacillota bacterium]|nr:molybdopterin-dependent oxidoreductase [Bacillota bacterium]
MSGYVDKVLNFPMKRRTFIKTTAVAAATLTVSGCGNELTQVSSDVANEIANKEGEWVTAPCWSNCGGRCINKALVVDGVVVRQKTDDSHPDSWDYFQQRGCVRGRSRRKLVFGADRLKYPMKRKHWEPGGGNKELRGKDEWVRISWDEALDIVASEIKRIKGTYSNESILCIDWGNDINQLLCAAGGHAYQWGTCSYGSWKNSALFGMEDGYHESNINDRYDLLNSQLIVMVGANPAWTSLGFPTNIYLKAKEAGTKFIVIDPFYSDTAQVLADEWVPIRPNTDHAMFLGMAHTLITEDNPRLNSLIDWDFLNRCTIGFDADHMPADADPTENFKDYVLGTYDGVPKSAEWAAEICGIEANIIQRLAREIANTKRTALLTGWAPARVSNSDSWPQMFMTLGAMTGHIGQPGRMTGVSCHFRAGNGGPSLVKPGGTGRPWIDNPISVGLNDAERWDAILKGKYTAGNNDVRDVNIQAIFYAWGGQHLQSNEGMTKGLEVHKNVEFVCTTDFVLNTQARYSDVVLPAATQWEKRPQFPWWVNRESLIFPSQVIDPVFETKSERWMCIELGKRLGIKENDLYPISEKQEVFNQLAGSKLIKEDCSDYESLCTITEKDIKEWGVKGQPQQGTISINEFAKKGLYQIQRKAGDQYVSIAYEDFRKDPVGHPLNTESGKFEIYCKARYDLVKEKGWSEIRPIPTYNPAVEGYEDTFKDAKAMVKGDFPLQMYTPHYPRRSHSSFDNIPWLREAFPNPVFVSRADADKRDIKDGDTVLLTSRHGKTLRNACVTERLMPGVVALPHGSWLEMDEKTNIDKGGADNILCNTPPTGQGLSAWNSCNVQVEKWTGEHLEEDCKWPQRILF